MCSNHLWLQQCSNPTQIPKKWRCLESMLILRSQSCRFSKVQVIEVVIFWGVDQEWSVQHLILSNLGEKRHSTCPPLRLLKSPSSFKRMNSKSLQVPPKQKFSQKFDQQKNDLQNLTGTAGWCLDPLQPSWSFKSRWLHDAVQLFSQFEKSELFSWVEGQSCSLGQTKLTIFRGNPELLITVFYFNEVFCFLRTRWKTTTFQSAKWCDRRRKSYGRTQEHMIAPGRMGRF